MKYLIFDKRKKVYLDKNLYYVKQNGEIFKTNSPIPTKLEEQERYEVRLILDGETNDKTN